MSTGDTFGKQVATACAILIDKFCLRPVDQQSSSSFGNAVVVLESDKLRVRIVRDRGRLRVEVASIQDRDRWFDFDIVMLRFGLDTEGAKPGTDASALLATWTSALVENYDEIAKLFSLDSFPRERPILEGLEWDRAQRVFGRHVERLSSE